MKKTVLVFSMTTLLILGGLKMATAQEQPAPKKDTVNMDTEAKPTFYYATEDEKAATDSKKGKFPLIPVIGGIVIVGAGAAFFLLKKKK
jgi:hypothetical protein